MTAPAPWAICNVELTELPERIEAPEACNAVFLIYRFKGVVLGYDTVLISEFPLLGSEIPARCAAKTCWTIRDWLALPPDCAKPAYTPRGASHYWNAPDSLTDSALTEFAALIDARRQVPVPVTASIAICTRLRPKDIAACLASIRAEIEGGREVIVVDNGPDPETEAAVRAYPQVRYIADTKKGANRARRTAIAAATGDIVVFIDDDVRPEPGWVEPLLRRFDDPNVGVVCGLVLPARLETQAQIVFQFGLGFGGMGHLPLRFDRDFIEGGWRGVPAWNIGAGANMAVRRSASNEIGGPDPRIGPGALGGSGDDTEFWHRMLFAGKTIIYDPMSIVRHEHRSDMPGLQRQSYGYGIGQTSALFSQFAENGDWGDLYMAFVSMPKYILNKLVRQPLRWLRGNPDPQIVDFAIGYLKGLRSLPLAFQKYDRFKED